jgi:hypothetical protein
MGISLGGGKSSGSQQAVLTPEQKETLQIQNAALRDVFMPAYTSTVGGAGQVYNQTNPANVQTAQTAMDVAGRAGALQEKTGAAGLLTGLGGMASLFNPNYESNQINAALQSGRESARESQAGQNAMYGAAGGLGSSRMALADRNLSSLNAQRQATAAAGAQAQVQQNRMGAAQSLINAGQSGLAGAQQSAASRIGYSTSPQDAYSKYASIVFGVPQQSTTPNFSGTQGMTGSSKGFGMSGSMGK